MLLSQIEKQRDARSVSRRPHSCDPFRSIINR
nr:MAG TPA: hypothetical protein [Caudoviricetes sp.]